MKMLFTQCKYETLQIMRNPYYVISSLLSPIIFYLIFTRLVNTNMPNQEAWQAHYLMSMATFSVMGSAIFTLGIRNVQERTQGWAEFMRVTPLPGSYYFFGKMVAQSVIHALSIIVIFLAGIFINGVSLPISVWIMSGSWIFAASFSFMALGTLIGTLKRVDTAAGVSNILYLGLAITGGMWMPLEILPEVMRANGKWLPSYSFGNGAWQIVAGKTPEVRNILILIGYMVVFMILSSYIRKKQEAV